MEFSLLATRVHPPPPARHLIARPELVETLEREIPAHRLTLVTAPAGYGKTTLLAEWARSSRTPVAWLSVEREENDRDRFFRSLLAAWERIEPDVRRSPLGLLLGGSEPDYESVIAAFIAQAEPLSDHLAIVIDDAHLLTDATIWDAVARLVDHLPPAAHLVLAGRGEPPLPVARYRARQELFVLGARDLALSHDEAGLLLRRILAREPAADELAALTASLEGWAAGVQLAGLALQHADPDAVPRPMSGRHHFIADYLREDVLAPLSPEINRFLIETSILERFCASLCDAVTGEPGGRSRDILEQLERGGLFLIPLDDARTWFRYHGLFSDVLRDELGRDPPDRVGELHRRAARWHHDHAFPEQALRHAMAGDDVELGVRIAEALFEIKLIGGDYESLGRWLDDLPAGWFAAYPTLQLFRAGLLLFTGSIEAGVLCMDELERDLERATRGDLRWNRARLIALRCAVACFMNDLPQAEAYADRALIDLPAEDHLLRSAIHHALGDTYRRNGQWDQARSHYLRALELTREPAYHIRSVHVLGALADLALEQGSLRQSALYWKRAIALIETRATWGTLPLPLTGWFFSRYAEIFYEWNELEEARRHLEQGIERSELGGDVRAIITGTLLRARLHLATGEIDRAVDDLERTRPLVEETAFPECAGRFLRCQVELDLARGRLTTALDETGPAMQPPDPVVAPEDARVRLAAVHARIVRGDHPARQRSLADLTGILGAAEAAGQLSVAIEALALQAIAHHRNGDESAAMMALERALRLAEPEGYVRLFVDLGLPMARLLQAARPRGVMPAYLERLLAAFTDRPAQERSRALPEPLSDRETEVLRLIAAGLTNREIADTLVISAETVKKHTSSIYGKLGVRGRTEAAARGRALGLLNEQSD